MMEDLGRTGVHKCTICMTVFSACWRHSPVSLWELRVYPRCLRLLVPTQLGIQVACNRETIVVEILAPVVRTGWLYSRSGMYFVLHIEETKRADTARVPQSFLPQPRAHGRGVATISKNASIQSVYIPPIIHSRLSTRACT